MLKPTILALVVAALISAGLGWVGRSLTEPDEIAVNSPDMAMALALGIERDGQTFGEYARDQFARAGKCPGAVRSDFGFTTRLPKKKTLPYAIAIQYSGTPDPTCDNSILDTLRFIALVDPVTGTVSPIPRTAEFPTAERWLQQFRPTQPVAPKA